MRILKVDDKDFQYAKAVNFLIDQAQLKLHNVAKEDLNEIVHTLNWVNRLPARMQAAEIEKPETSKPLSTRPKKLGTKRAVK